MLDHPCIKLTSSVARALEPISEGGEINFHMRLPLCIELRDLSAAIDMIYIDIYIYIYKKIVEITTLNYQEYSSYRY